MVRLLLHHKADANIKGRPRQKTPINMAARVGAPEILKILLGHPEIDANVSDAGLDTRKTFKQFFYSLKHYKGVTK